MGASTTTNKIPTIRTLARSPSCLLALVSTLFACVGCSSKPAVLPQDEFWAGMSGLCGKAYPGRVVIDSTDSPTFRNQPLTLHVDACSEERIEMPLLVDGQPWVTLTLSRDEGQLELVHDHASDELPSGYGGRTRAGGTPVSQDFYANDYTIALEPDAGDTIWTLEIRTGSVLGYALRREGSNRRFRAVFDLSRGRPAPTMLREEP